MTPVWGGVTLVTYRYRSKASDLTAGVTLGGGLERILGPLRFNLEARLTRWKMETCYSNDLRCVSPNQGAVQLGIGF